MKFIINNSKFIIVGVIAFAMTMGASACKHKDVRVTAYMPVASQCNATPNITADGSRIDLARLKAGRLRWCAVSRDLLKCHPYGSRLYVEGRGWYVVHDTTNKRLRNTVDILIHQTAKGFCEKGEIRK